VRAELLDESINILQGLWSGKPFSYKSKHYDLHEAAFQLTPLQSPRIPIWVVAAWPLKKSMARALRCDGILPVKATPEGMSSLLTPEDIRAIKAYVDKHREQPTPFDIVMEGETPGKSIAQAQAIVQPFIEAGATWWMEDVASRPYKMGGLEGVRVRIHQGPPHRP
jgi:alkanesulfonate monooxygenase SsuD/methylene tetrahydromethanopterin reductase-like flavin-dependent oxidoreductase (luciferase family)